MDESKRNCSKFQGVLLDVVKTRLNLMLSEICQLSTQGEPIDFENNRVLVKTILKKIANNKIKSAHISAEEAICIIDMFDELDSHTEKTRTRRFAGLDDEDDGRSVYLDSPFK